MADLTVTAANVTQVDGGVIDGIAGETITAGQAVYLDTTTGLFMKAINNSTAAIATVAGIALHGSALNQPLRVQASGTINAGATVAIGVTYCLSATSGGICPDTDVGTGNTKYKSVIGVGTTAARLAININNSGVKVA